MTDRQVFSPIALHTQALACGRGGMTLCSNLNISVAGGQCLLLRGPNGTGKTTLLLTLAGVVAPMAGTMSFASAADSELGPILHHCGHRNAIKARLTVLENLRYWAAVNGSSGLPAEQALDEVGLGRLAELDAGYLSAGQSRRLALARLLVSERPIWLMDEPTAALDVEGHQLVSRLLDAHLDMGGLAIVATHDRITLSDPARLLALDLGEHA
jgi:heme exporter protein A